jgi:tetratricopeptide (TPR) repeat protein
LAWINRTRCRPITRLGYALSLTLGLSLLCACSTQPKAPASGGKAADAAFSPDPSGKIANPEPNPYLARAGQAPAAAQSEFARAQSLIKAGNSAQAQSLLLGLQQKYPKLSGIPVNLALIAWKQKNYPQAQAYFEQAQAANAYNPDAYTQYAVMLREQGKFADAQAQYLKALAVWPHNRQAHRDLGVLYDLYLGQWDKALQHYTLCDQLSAEPDKEIKGWIADLQRRINKKAEVKTP